MVTNLYQPRMNPNDLQLLDSCQWNFILHFATSLDQIFILSKNLVSFTFFLEQINKVGRVSGLVNTSLPFADDVLLLAYSNCILWCAVDLSTKRKFFINVFYDLWCHALHSVSLLHYTCSQQMPWITCSSVATALCEKSNCSISLHAQSLIRPFPCLSLCHSVGLWQPRAFLIRNLLRRIQCYNRIFCIWINIPQWVREREWRGEWHYGHCPKKKISCDSCLLCLSRPCAMSQCGLFANTKVVMDFGFISEETCSQIGLCPLSGTGGI